MAQPVSPRMSRNFDVNQNWLKVRRRVFPQFGRIVMLDFGIFVSSSGQPFVQFSKVLQVKSIFGDPFPGDQQIRLRCQSTFISFPYGEGVCSGSSLSIFGTVVTVGNSVVVLCALSRRVLMWIYLNFC